ncbi:unnamed protein product [Ixodes pacificus]
MANPSRVRTSRVTAKYAIIGLLTLLRIQQALAQNTASGFEEFYEVLETDLMEISTPTKQAASDKNDTSKEATRTATSTKRVLLTTFSRVICKAVRNYTSTNSSLLFTCGVRGGELGTVHWRIHPPGCCLWDETYRQTRTMMGSENADIQISMTPLRAGPGYVHARVYNSEDQVIHEETLPFLVTDTLDKDACRKYVHCNSNRSECQVVDALNNTGCVCTTVTYPHYDGIHGVCYSAKRLGQHCEYSHECYSGQDFSACDRGVCVCNRYTHQGSAGNETRCLQAAHLGETCDQGLRTCVGAGVRCLRRQCVCLANLTRDILRGCVPVEVKPEAVRSVSQLLWNAMPVLLVALLVLSVTGIVLWTRRMVPWCKDSEESSVSREGSIVGTFAPLSPPKSSKANSMVGPEPNQFSSSEIRVGKMVLESAL